MWAPRNILVSKLTKRVGSVVERILLVYCMSKRDL
jgi:hypothetical protein